jgi:hypothetical protein
VVYQGKSMKNNSDLLKFIIFEEISGLSKSLFTQSKVVPGTIIVKRTGDQLMSPEDVEAIETLADKLADSLESPRDFLKLSNDLYSEIQSMSEQISSRFHPQYKADIFSSLHSAKEKIKTLRENKTEELCSIKHAAVSKYVEMLNEHLRDITDAENYIQKAFGEFSNIVEKNKTNLLVKSTFEQYSEIREAVINKNNINFLYEFDSELTALIYKALKVCENKSRFTI